MGNSMHSVACDRTETQNRNDDSSVYGGSFGATATPPRAIQRRAMGWTRALSRNFNS